MKNRLGLILLIAMVALFGLLATACAGTDGADGSTGPAGAAGSDGAVGPAGPAGSDGTDGDAGSAGAAGAPGPAGAAGAKGATGATGATGPVAVAIPNEYIGMDACGECHDTIYDTFVKSGHPYKLSRVVDGVPPTYPFTTLTEVPEGYTWNDITYVIGGYNWKARFIDKDGYIITGDADATTQYNFPNENLGTPENWVGYHAGEENKVYDCGTCHTTGYNPIGHQDDLPGLIGTWTEPGVRCEECHGPGSAHADQPYAVEMPIDRDAEACGNCHLRGSSDQINASGGFIKHHEQYEELFQSKHLAIDCVACHDPHEGVVQHKKDGTPTTKVQCESCHFLEEIFQSSEVMAKVVECKDCHMPYLIKNAMADAEQYAGDIRTHMWAINPYATSQFTEDGSEAISQVSLDFACKSCHRATGDASALTDEELKAEAIGYHARP